MFVVVIINTDLSQHSNVLQFQKKPKVCPLLIHSNITIL